MYSLTVEKGQGYIILRHEGTLTLEDAVLLRSELGQHMKEKGIRKIALDLHATRKADSSGLGALVSAQCTGISYGRSLYLLNPAPLVLDLLKELELEGFFGIIYSEDSLMESEKIKRQQGRGDVPNRAKGLEQTADDDGLL